MQRPSDLKPWFGHLIFWPSAEDHRPAKVRIDDTTVVSVSTRYVHKSTAEIFRTLILEHPDARVAPFDPDRPGRGAKPTAIVIDEMERRP